VRDSASDMSAWQREVILHNVEKDPYYAPYCMRCRGPGLGEAAPPPLDGDPEGHDGRPVNVTRRVR
jgi:hypothetical protein